MTITKEGALASFYTVNKAPIKHLRVYFSPKQAGTGDPSPENVREIEGYAGIKVFHAYDDICSYNDISAEDTYLDNNGNELSNNRYFLSKYIPVSSEKKYTVMPDTSVITGTAPSLCWYDNNKTFISGVQHNNLYTYCNDLTPPLNAAYMRDSIRLYGYTYKCLEHKDYSLNWSDTIGTVYGGYVDLVTGELVEEWSGSKTLNGSDDISSPNRVKVLMQYSGIDVFGAGRNFSKKVDNAISSVYCDSLPIKTELISDDFPYLYLSDNGTSIGYTVIIGKLSDHSELTTDSARLQFVSDWLKEHNVTIYWKSTPVTYELTPTQLQTLLGRNNIWSNADRVEVEYNLAESNDELYRRRNIILRSAPHIVTPEPAALQHFTTDIAAPLKECKIHFSPVQAGSGDPSPDNVREISGWNTPVYCLASRVKQIKFIDFSNATITGGTANLNADGSLTIFENSEKARNITCSIEPINVTTDLNMFILGSSIKDLSENKISFKFLDNNDNTILTFIPSTTMDKDDVIAYYNIPENFSCSRVKITVTRSVPNITISPFLCAQNNLHANPYWTSTAGTIYGGYMDLINGKIVKTFDEFKLNSFDFQQIVNFNNADGFFFTIVGMYGGVYAHDSCAELYSSTFKVLPILEINTNSPIWSCSISNKGNGIIFLTPKNMYSNKNEFLEAYGNETVIMKTTNPITYSLSPAQLKSFVGTNNIWSNSNGPIELSYWTH